MDGWRVADLKLLPLFFLNGLADVFNAIERKGRWPAALLHAHTTLIGLGTSMERPARRPSSRECAELAGWPRRAERQAA